MNKVLKNVLKATVATAAVAAISITALRLGTVTIPMKLLRSAYAEQEQCIDDIITNNTIQPKIALTAEQLSNLTDELVVESFSTLSDSYKEFFANYDNSFGTYVNALLKDFTDDYTYDDFITISDYIKNRANNSDITIYEFDYYTAQYTQDILCAVFYAKSEIAIKDCYESYYSDYAKLTEFQDVSTPFEMNDLIERVAKSERLVEILRANATSTNRILQAIYSNVVTEYISVAGGMDTIFAPYFGKNITTEKQLLDLNLLACSDFEVTGYTIPLYLSEEDIAAILDKQKISQERLALCNKLFNITDLGKDVTGVGKLLQKYAMRYQDKVYQELYVHNIEEEVNYLNTGHKLSDKQKERYKTREFVFWNSMMNMVTFSDIVTEVGVPMAHINMINNSNDYIYLLGGNFVNDNDQLKSLLWATAEEYFLSVVYNNCDVTTAEDGSITPNETEDPVVLGYRNLLEAWNVWGSQFAE